MSSAVTPKLGFSESVLIYLFCNQMPIHDEFSFIPFHVGERAFTPTLLYVHPFKNSFHSAISWTLRMSAVTGSSFGVRGIVRSFKPASCGRRLPFLAFTD